MIYAFTEAQKREIEKTGHMVVEVKRALRKKEGIKRASAALAEIARAAGRAMRILADVIENVIDSVKFLVEEFHEARKKRTSFRYKVVKILSKCTGIEKLRIWKMTRHTFLARSFC